LDAGSLTQLYSSLCATPINSSNTPQLSQQAVADLSGKGLAAAVDLQRKAVNKTGSNQRIGRLVAEQADCMQQDCTDSNP